MKNNILTQGQKNLALFLEMCSHNVDENSGKRIQKLLDSGANIESIDQYGHTVLMWASSYAPEFLELVLNNGADVNKETPEHKSALLLSVGKVNTDASKVVETLLKAGAKFNFKDNNGETVFDKALKVKNYEAIEILLEAGLNPNGKSNKRGATGHTLFMDAVSTIDSISCLDKFVEMGANVNSVRKNGETVLMLAAFDGKVQNVKWLLNKGADPYVKDDKGRNFLDYGASKDIEKELLNILNNFEKEKILKNVENKSLPSSILKPHML